MNTAHIETGKQCFQDGCNVFIEGQGIKSLSLLYQGKMDILISPFENVSGIDEKSILENSYRIFDIEHQSFIGICDLLLEKECLFTYKSVGDIVLYDFGIQNNRQLKTLIDSHKEFRNSIVNSVLNFIGLSCKALDDLKNICKKLKALVKNFSVYYWFIWEKLGNPVLSLSSFMEESRNLYIKLEEDGFPFPSDLNPGLLEKILPDGINEINDPGNDNRTDTLDDTISRIEYYRSVSNLQRDVSLKFFGSDPQIAYYGCTDASECFAGIIGDLKSTIGEIHTCLYDKLLSETGECILGEYRKLALQSAGYGSLTEEITAAMRYMTITLKEILSVMEKQYGVKPRVDVDQFNDISDKTKANELKIVNSFDTIPEELNGSLKKILAFSGIQQEKAVEFMAAIDNFRTLSEGALSEGVTSGAEFKNIRNVVTPLFFEIYKSVFKRVQAEKIKSRLFSMFLNFGYMDERLLTCDQVNTLYSLADKQPYQGRTQVYYMEDWLEKIYSMEKDPSCDEFGFDYYDTFRNLKKQRKVSEGDKLEYINNIDCRLDFEVDNMVRINHKLCYGHISAYFPVLNKSMIIRDLHKAMVTPEAVNQCIEKILEIDFSAFHRELTYINPEKGIEKELIMKAIYPDVILVPIYGTRGMMWQELSGRMRNTPGRFILPVFTSENLYNLIVKLVGNFRWELCKTMMGVYWNDITLKSLTSEYSDYIQFYKKDWSLSDTAKSKIKTQIQRYNGRLREIFTSDYEIWINYESKGIARLNKTVRNILFQHCPFSKPIRDRLENFPAYAEAISRFKITRAKKAKELEARFNNMERSGIKPDEEQIETLRFYKEL